MWQIETPQGTRGTSGMGVRVLGYGSLTLPIFNLSPNTRHFRPMRLWAGVVVVEDYLPPGIRLTLLTWIARVLYIGL